jgi:hypothetical protein
MTNQRLSGTHSVRFAIAFVCGAVVFLANCEVTSPVMEPTTVEKPTPAEEPPPEVVFPRHNTEADMIAGTGGFDYGEPVANSMHTQFGVSCLNACHVAPTVTWREEAGSEAYLLRSADGVENVAACGKCHPPAVGMGLKSFNSSRFNRHALGDYDGNGAVEGVQTEVVGLLNVLFEAIKDSGVETLDEEPYWKNVTTEAQRAAIYNWSFVSHDRSLGVHNTARSVQLLQRSYENLTGGNVHGADLYTPVAVPEVKPSPVQIEPLMERAGVLDGYGRPVRTTALAAVGVGTYVLLRGFSRDIRDDEIAGVEWSLTSPDGSEQVLTNLDKDHVHFSFVAEAPGWYTVKFGVTDSKGVITYEALRINSAPYVGVGGVAGDMAIAPECASCHPGRAETWSETTHAGVFARKIDGGGGPANADFDEGSLARYTLAYDPAADNGGFDEVAAQVGWTLPKLEMRRPGTWDAMPIRLKQFASVQCESCHGPGGRWIGTAISLSANSCGYCHDAPPRHVMNLQWRSSGHADAASPAFGRSFGDDTAACRRCHSAEGFIDFTAGKEGSLRRWAGRTGFQTVTCAACHDPHSAEHEAQLRVYDTVSLPDGTAVSRAGASALCMTCHNGRVGPDQVAEDDPHYPHYSTAAEMIAGTGGYDYGEPIEDSMHQAMGIGCVTCHMAPTPGWVGDKEGGKGLPGHDEVGAHTFRLTSRNGVENIAACTACHPGLASFNSGTFGRSTIADYDGNGAVQGVQDEVSGLLDVLLEAIQASGVKRLDHYPYWDNVTTKAQKAAIYNWSFVGHDKSLGIHNTARSVQLLQRSYKDLTSRDVPKADLR